jgi:hypothetical protein
MTELRARSKRKDFNGGSYGIACGKLRKNQRETPFQLLGISKLFFLHMGIRSRYSLGPCLSSIHFLADITHVTSLWAVACILPSNA